MPTIDVDAYFDRIQWSGPVRVDHATLAGLLRAHMRRIPFENLDVLLGRPIRLDPEGLQDKLVRARRGGYCFEQASLFAGVLEALGFAPVRHSARVVLVAPRTASPRTHMLLTVPLPEGTFVVDPGFGGLASDAPLRLSAPDEEPPGDATHWLARDGPYTVLRARTDGKIVDCWVSTLEADHEIDFIVANHYVSTHPESGFVNRLMLRALTDEGRVSAMNREVTLRGPAGTRQFTLPDRAALRALLAQHFGFDLPEVESLRVPSIEEWR
ncbi:MAG: arylamine N-acetyltransferase family protein [Rudaea sp.]